MRKAVFLLLVFISSSVQATESVMPTVPMTFAFQSEVFDGGGNPIPDGAVTVRFSISNVAEEYLYEETQVVNVMRGILSAMVGSGVDLNGAPTGGIPLAAFISGPVFLLAEVEGYPALPLMEIGSAPYALVSQRALSVQDGVVTSVSVADGSLEITDVSENFISSLAQKLGESESVMTKSGVEEMFREPSSAEKIGVKKGFNYSASSNLQDTLADIDLAVRARDERISIETNERKSADQSLQAAVDSKMPISGGTITGDVVISGNLSVQNSISEAKLPDHVHNGADGQGGTIFPSAIWFDAGIRLDGETVAVPAGYSQSQCKVTTSIAQYFGWVEGIDVACSWPAWVDGGVRVGCRFSGGPVAEGSPNDNCQALMQGAGQPCSASYVVMCAKGM